MEFDIKNINLRTDISKENYDDIVALVEKSGNSLFFGGYEPTHLFYNNNMLTVVIDVVWSAPEIKIYEKVNDEIVSWSVDAFSFITGTLKNIVSI